MEIFKLFGSIMVDSAEAQKSISNAGDKADGFASKLGSGIVTAGKWAVGVGAAAVAVGGAMIGAANGVASAADEIDKASRRAGTSAENWQKLDYAMGQSGISSETLEKTMIKNQKALNEAADGSSKAASAYSDLGVSVRDVDGGLRDADDVYQDTIRSLAEMTDTNERNRLANELFGKSYGELAPLLDAGASGIDELTARAEELGIVMSQETVDAGVKFGDTMDDVTQAVGAVWNMFAAQLLPILQGFLDWVLGHMPEIQSVIGTVFGVVQTVVSSVHGVFKDNVLPILAILFDWVRNNMPTIQAVFKEVFGFVLDIANQVWGIFKNNLLPILEALWDFISPTFPLIEGVVKVTFGAIVKTVQTVVTIFEKVTSAIKTAIEWLQFWKTESGDRSDGGDFSQSRDGNHASGLPYVPYDGYTASLHRGETILSADSSQDMASTIINGIAAVMGGQQQGNGTTNINLNVDGKTLASVLFDPLKNTARQRGVSLA